MYRFRKWLFTFCTVCRGSRSGTVRYAFPLVVAAAALMGAQAITSQPINSITVVPSTNSLRAGEPFSLAVYVTAIQEINAVDLDVTFPTEQMRITGIDTGESVITLWTEEPYVEDNTVVLRGGTFRRGFKGEHLIATINAEATETGIAEIRVTDQLLLAGDGAGTIVTTDESGGQTQVYISSEDGVAPQGVASGQPGSISGSIDINILTDIDGDGEVSLADVSRFMAGWFQRNVIYDFNGDGQMTFRDFGIILSDSFFK